MKFENQAQFNKLVDKSDEPIEPDFEFFEQRDLIEKFLDHAILNNYQKIDSGQNGIIGLVDIQTVKNDYLNLVSESKLGFVDVDDTRLDKVFKERFGALPENDDKMVTKMLKIYSDEKADNEAQIQTEMFKLVKGAKETAPNKDYAEIPNIYFNRSVDLKLYPHLKDKLLHDEVRVDEDKVNVLAMDYLRGENLDYYLHKETLLAHGYSLEDCQGANYQWMQKNISDLAIKGFALAMENDNFSTNELKRLNRENLSALAKFLSQNDNEIPESVFKQIKNTMDLAHDNEIYHRDLHERNLFLRLNEKREIQGASIIDWGEAIHLNIPENSESMEKKSLIYGDENEQYLSDSYIFKYEKLLASAEVIEQHERMAFFNKIDTSLITIKKLLLNSDLDGKSLELSQAYQDMIEELGFISEDTNTLDKLLPELDNEFKNFSDLAIVNDDLDKFRLRIALWRDFIATHQNMLTEADFINYLSNEKPSHLRYLENEKAKLIEYSQKK